MQDDIKPPATENSDQPKEELSVQTPPAIQEVQNAPVSAEEPTASSPLQADEQVIPEVPQTPKLPESKNEHHAVPIILALIVLLLLAGVAIISGNR